MGIVQSNETIVRVNFPRVPLNKTDTRRLIDNTINMGIEIERRDVQETFDSLILEI